MESYKKKYFFSKKNIFYAWITVPELLLMAVDKVIITRFTPASMAAKAFSILGIMPPEMIHFSTY